MDKTQIQEKARNIGKFTLEVLDDLFGKRVLIFVYVLAAVFAASVLFQVFTKYVYEEGSQLLTPSSPQSFIHLPKSGEVSCMVSCRLLVCLSFCML